MGHGERKRGKESDHLPAVPSQDALDRPVAVEKEVRWSGPLPPPDVLREFRKAVPRSDEVILGEYEKQGEHRRSTETRESRAHAFAIRALSAGTVLTNLTTIGGAIFLSSLGHLWGAGIVIAGPLVTVALGRLKSKEE